MMMIRGTQPAFLALLIHIWMAGVVPIMHAAIHDASPPDRAEVRWDGDEIPTPDYHLDCAVCSVAVTPTLPEHSRQIAVGPVNVSSVLSGVVNEGPRSLRTFRSSPPRAPPLA